jgi:alanine racemase
MKLNLTSTEFGQIIDAKSLGTHNDMLLSEVAFDSRNINNSQVVVFFALKGARENGEKYVADAYQKGVRCFVLSTIPTCLDADALYFIVPDTLVALQNLATYHRKRLAYPVLAITGSVGKTTVKEWLAHLLGPYLKVYRSPKSYNSQLGVALSLLALPLDGDLALIEAAVTKPGEMERLHAMILPDYCIITNTSKSLRHEFAQDKAYQEALELLAVGSKWQLNGSLWSPADSEQLKVLTSYIPFTDPVSIYNAQLAIAAALQFHSIEATQIVELPALANRLETVEGINGAVLINDSYNLDLNAFEASLAFLNAKAEGKPLMVCCVLDKAHNDLKAPISALISAKQITNFYIWDELPFNLPDIAGHVVLIKSSTPSIAALLLGKWKLKSHSTQVRYDLAALAHNLRQYRAGLNAETKILAMVKAQAYGAGMVQIAQQLQISGIDYFGVAYADEGVLLRQAGIQTPILVMNAEPNAFEVCISNQLEPAIYSLEHLDAFIRTLISQEKLAYPIHLKFDTGMHRLGFLPDQTQRVLQMISAQPEVLIKSIYSHMACADEPLHPMNESQIQLFNEICAQFTAALPYAFIRHLLNSEGAAHFSAAQYDMVRLGIGLFGVNHDPSFEVKLKPVLSWTSRISQLKKLKKGACVGYGCSAVLSEDSQIAVIPVGYADGFSRQLSNGCGGVYIDGTFCPTVGRVCMDMIMVLAPNARPDAIVEIIGPNQSLSAFAQKANTIPYEILTSISPRVLRTYTNA